MKGAAAAWEAGDKQPAANKTGTMRSIFESFINVIETSTFPQSQQAFSGLGRDSGMDSSGLFVILAAP